MENLLLTVLISNASIIVLVCVLWYVIGLFTSLVTIYITDSIITLMGLLLSLIVAILGPVLILVFLLIKYELFDDIIIYKKRNRLMYNKFISKFIQSWDQSKKQ